MSTPSRRPPSRQQLRGLAMFGGLMIGLGLLSMMRPGGDSVRPPERTWNHTPTPSEVSPPGERPARRQTEPPARQLRTGERPDDAPAPEAVDPDAPVDVSFVVRDAKGRRVQALVEPLDCPGIEFTSPTSFRAPPGPCVVRALRQDGLLTARGEPVELRVRPGVDATLDIPMEAPPVGGVGVQFRGTSDGMRVSEVLPGTPAERAGLEAGDLIVEIEGESVVGSPIEDFVEQMTGPEGSDVEFTVEFTTDTGTTRQRVLVTRERIGS